MTELNAQEILKKYEKTNKIIMRIFEIQRKNVKELETSMPIREKYFGSLSKINHCIVNKIKYIKHEIKEKNDLSSIEDIENKFLTRVNEEDICNKMIECFSCINIYMDENLIPYDDASSRQFLIQSMYDLRDAIEKIPEFANSHPK